MAYVDGFVIPVPTAIREDYQRLAQQAAALFREHGALMVVERWADDSPDGKLTSFPLAIKCEKDETVVMSWIIWPSRAARDAGSKQAMADPRMAMIETMPFDGKRLIVGGFKMMFER